MPQKKRGEFNADRYLPAGVKPLVRTRCQKRLAEEMARDMGWRMTQVEYMAQQSKNKFAPVIRSKNEYYEFVKDWDEAILEHKERGGSVPVRATGKLFESESGVKFVAMNTNVNPITQFEGNSYV